MNDEKKQKKQTPEEREGFYQTVCRKEDRKLEARKKQQDSVWFGLGMFGVVGWSVSLFTLAGIALGVWIDRTWPSQYSWTLMFLIIGVILGCLNAWFWLKREGRV